MTCQRFISCMSLLMAITAFAACSGEAPDVPGAASSQNDTSAAAEAPRTGTSSTIERLHRQLKVKNPSYDGQGKFRLQDGQVVAAVLRNADIEDLTPLEDLPLRGIDLYGNPVEDLGPLRNMPLQAVYLEDTQVHDLTPLRGMSLQALYLSNTAVADLSPLRDMPLRELNLLGTPVRDLSPIAEVPLRMLWLNDTPVEDIDPLENSSVMSLTLKGTRISNISAVQTMQNLERLHIADTPVTDLRPLEGLQLTRLVFTPSNIRRGMNVVREMSSLQEIGTAFNTQTRSLMKPDQFWQKFDEGTLQPSG